MFQLNRLYKGKRPYLPIHLYIHLYRDSAFFLCTDETILGEKYWAQGRNQTHLIPHYLSIRTSMAHKMMPCSSAKQHLSSLYLVTSSGHGLCSMTGHNYEISTSFRSMRTLA